MATSAAQPAAGASEAARVARAASAAWAALLDFADGNQGADAGAAAALALAPLGLCGAGAEIVLARGTDVLREGAIAALWRRLAPFEAHAAALRAAAERGRISKLLPASGSAAAAGAAWVMRELPAALDDVARTARALTERVAVIEAAATEAGAGDAVRGATARARGTTTPLVLTTAPPEWMELLERYFDCQLALFNSERRADDVAAETEDDEGEGGEEEGEACDEGATGGGMEGVQVEPLGGADAAAQLSATCASMRELGLESMYEAALGAAVHRLARCHLRRVAERGLEETVVPSALSEMREWAMEVPAPFMALALGASTPLSDAQDCELRLEQWRMRLDLYIVEQTGEVVTSHLFDVVKAALADDADVSGVLADLKEYLRTPRAHQLLVSRFHTSLRKRLLHAGVATAVILQVYVSAIKAMRSVDPSGVLLEAAGAPIREYLRSRRDTIRCVVMMLTDDDSGGDKAGMESLLGELEGEEGAVDAEESDDDDADGCSPEVVAAATRWEPEPVEAEAWSSARGGKRTTDIISMLVGIYGSKELFVSEYRVMLADRLLTRGGYDTDREIRTLELLKMRFGEANLHTCEVMLKDIADSKRINANVRGDAGATTPYKRRANRTPGKTDNEGEAEAAALKLVDATVVSSLFWPPFNAGDGDKLALPPAVEAGLKAYAGRFGDLRAPRKLEWRRALGCVTLELHFDESGLEREFTVSPMHATIIAAFGDRKSWGAEELAARVGVPVALLRRKAVYWVNQGVLLERRQGNDLIFEASSTGTVSSGPATAGAPAGEEEPESAVASAEEQAAAEMAVYESYITGMLTNFDELPLDRIHNMLKMFVSDPPYDKSSAQLAAFMAKLAAEDKIEHGEGGTFKLKR